jgi:hypothetical protein
MKDYAFMNRNTELFMSLWCSYRPVICKVHGHAVAGGSDASLRCLPETSTAKPTSAQADSGYDSHRTLKSGTKAGCICSVDLPY